MAIQFLCKSCGQPIEVDDNLAGRSVKCPYCQQTTETPMASTWQPGAAPPPAASPGSPTPPMGVPPPPGPGFAPPTPGYGFVPPPPPAARPPIVGYVSVGLAIVNAVILLATAMSFSGLLEGLTYPPKTPEQAELFQTEIKQRMETKPGLSIGVSGGCCVLPLAALVCGIVSLALRQTPKWPAILGLVLVFVGGIGFFCVVSVMAGAASAAGAG